MCCCSCCWLLSVLLLQLVVRHVEWSDSWIPPVHFWCQYAGGAVRYSHPRRTGRVSNQHSGVIYPCCCNLQLDTVRRVPIEYVTRCSTHIVDLMMLVFAVPTHESGVSRVSHTSLPKLSLFSIRCFCHTQYAGVGIFSHTLGCSFCGGLSTVSSFINEVSHISIRV